MTIKENPKPDQYGLVISYFGNSVAVETDDGQVFPCHLRRNQELPVVGDRVRWQLESDISGIILGIEPRRSMLARGNVGGTLKPIAANIDVLVVVMSPPPVFSEYLIDRYLIASELLKINPIIVLNKIDLLNDATCQSAFDRLDIYRHIPYCTLSSSIYMTEGLIHLADYLKNKTAVLVGPSGVGKSSLIAALSHQEKIRIAKVSPKGAGKHTTTSTQLYHLPQGGNVIDSPGVREFSLWSVTKPDLLKGFKEFKPFLTGCKFRDCQHRVEPGCLVQDALANGKINANRFASYQELMKNAI
jgi:ribosome biogenesis GTPase